MKWMILFSLALWQPLPVQEEGTKIKLARGSIVKVGNFGYGIVPDSDKGTRYAPKPLPETFHTDGLRVIFSGTVGAVPNGRGGRVWGTPLALTHIELEQ